MAVLALAACAPTTAGPGTSASGSGVTQVAITLTGDTGDACTVSPDSVPAGPVTFTVTNRSSTGITELELLDGARILGEKENLAPGLPAVSFTLTLGGGRYSVYCPGAQTPNTPFTVTGAAAPTATGDAAQLLQQGTAEYGQYVATQIAGMVTAVANLETAVDSGDVAAAQEKYALARPFYEKVESDVSGFLLPGAAPTSNRGNLDYLIDMRASSLDPAVGWSGLHAIERDLWQGGAITDQTKKYASDLVSNVTELASLAQGLNYRPEDLANGAAALLEEIQSNKISGEEERYSHLDLLDFAANIEGAQQAFAALQPGLTRIDPALAATVAREFGTVNGMLDIYRDASIPGGFTYYTPAVRAADGAALSKAVQALQEPMSQIAEKVATAQ
ncbi:iron uptake system protein EfeO [Gryllotalpicola sp.]|uniref:iron uptake system protein EfeO n=1 Tax=Gryllotalpicola sp. TaxID=1932787 RepID=UPI00262A50CA|nr:iron uptake system protein EfeO [Gryllotalpicola sp.]